MNTIDFSREIRRTSLEIVHACGGSHISSSLSIADILAVLYRDVMKTDSANPNWEMRDRFILSKGHATAALYSALMLRGFVGIKELKTYGLNGSLFMNHASHKVPGVEFSTGALGHGLPIGVGMAVAAKYRKLNHRIFVLVSDGEIAEGTTWEAALFANHHQLDNLTVIVDFNNLQSLDTVSNTLEIQPLSEKFIALGWVAKDVDGHNHDELRKALKETPKKPNLICAHTTKGKGVSFMEGLVEWHYKCPSIQELSIALEELNA